MLSTQKVDNEPKPQETQNPLLSSEELEAFHRLSREKNRIIFRKPQAGWEFNPLRNLDRNMKCPCLSGKKFKKCHLNMLPELVKHEEAENYRHILRTAKEIHFVTKESEQKEQASDSEGDSAPPDQGNE